MTLPSVCGCYEDTGGFHPCAEHSGARAITAPDLHITPTITVTPDAVGRGEREEVIQRARQTSRQLRTRAAGLLEGEEVHASAGDFANAADRIDNLLALLPALPPDAGGEDGERDNWRWLEEGHHSLLCYESKRDGGFRWVVGDAKPCATIQEAIADARAPDPRDEEDRYRLPAARRSATERKGGGN